MEFHELGSDRLQEISITFDSLLSDPIQWEYFLLSKGSAKLWEEFALIPKPELLLQNSQVMESI